MADTIYNKTADSTLDVYKPAKVLQISFTSATGHKNWTHNDGEGDLGGVAAVLQSLINIQLHLLLQNTHMVLTKHVNQESIMVWM